MCHVSSVTCHTAKTEKLLHFFHSGGHKTNFKAFIWIITLEFLFCICLSIYYSNPRMESKRYLDNKNTSFLTFGIGVLCPPGKNPWMYIAMTLYASYNQFYNLSIIFQDMKTLDFPSKIK